MIGVGTRWATVVESLINLLTGTAAWQAMSRRLRAKQEAEKNLQLQLEIQRQHRILGAILAATPDGTAMLDQGLRIVYASDNFLANAGLPSWRVVGNTLADLGLPASYTEPLQAMALEALRTGKRTSVEARLPTPLGVRYFSYTLSPIAFEKGEVSSVVLTAADVTEFKDSERKLQNRTAELEEANRQLALADRHKDEFLSVISHELRTPLNFITGFVSILQDELAGPITPKQEEYLGKVQEGADLLVHLVDDLLDIPLIKAGKMQ